MTSDPQWDAAAVEQAVAQLSSLRPAYAHIIGFYGPVFVAQARALKRTDPGAIDIDEALLAMKSSQGFSLVEPSAFKVDLPVAEDLLTRICHIAVQSGEKLGSTGEALIRAMGDGEAMDMLLTDVLLERRRIKALAKTMDAPLEMLSLLLYLAVKPSLQAGARQLASRLDGSQKNRGSCPICGSQPIIGELDGDGRQWMHCGWCWHRWPVKRIACLFCSRRERASVEYLYSDDEPEYRVNLCRACKRYLKVVDTRKMDRGFYPPLEQVASLHLDMLAAQKGYSHAVASTISTVE